MELTADLVAIQGILTSVTKSTGDFTRINYRGGNEQKILDIMVQIQTFISNKNYIKDGQVNTVFDKQLADIVFFLALNTTYKKPLELKEFSHLTSIMPQLSKCLFVNIVYGLDLCKFYCTVIEKLPIYFTSELLDETIPCLKKSVPKVHLKYAYMFLEATANKLGTISFSEKVEEYVDDISEITNIMLQNLTGLYSDQTKNWKAVQIYCHMGYSLLSLFDLLLHYDMHCCYLSKIITNTFRASCSLVRNVTINVFCTWAEVLEDSQPLQSVVSEKAYLVVEKYEKYPEAKELISMLGTIAKKPKTLNELIREADLETIINKVNRKDQDQQSWFRALLNTSFFNSKEGLACVSTWIHLCNEEDVTRLLNISVQNNNVEVKKLAIKSASTLTTNKLVLVSIRHFYKNKFDSLLNENIQPQLMMIFNKLSESNNSNDDLLKEIHLLLLQNAPMVLSYIFSECLKNNFYTSVLKDILLSIEEIYKINNVGTEKLKDVIFANKPSMQNVCNYTELFNTLKSTSHFCTDKILLNIMCPLLEELYTKKCFEDLNCALQVLLEAEIKILVHEKHANVIKLVFDIMNGSRCKFLEFSNVKQQNASYAVDIITNLCEINPDFKVDLPMDDVDLFATYYRKYLCGNDSSLLKHMLPEFDINNYAGCVSQIIKFLPLSVTFEWLHISEELLKLYGSEKTMELMTDVMILLCQVVETQKHIEETGEQLLSALKYCIQHLGIIIQQNIHKNSTLDTEVHVTRYVCGLLRKLPETIKEEEGASLINILTDRSLKFLATDRNFVCGLISINNTHICQSLAQRMTS